MLIKPGLCAFLCLPMLQGPAAGGPTSRVGPDTGGITLELIMQDPAWIARSPEGAYWSDDGASVFFRRQREGTDLHDLHRVTHDGVNAQLVQDDALAGIDVGGGDWSRDRTRKVFVRDGDLFIKDIGAGSERQLTRTSAGESSPRFMADETSVQFRRGGTLLVRDLGAGLEWEPADIKFAKTPDEAKKKKEKDKTYLDRQQDRFFEVLEDHRDTRDERQERSRALREIDKSDVPGPFYLPDGLEERRRSLSPGGRWMIVIGAKPAEKDKRDEMPKYVTESGYVDTVNVRPKVGIQTRRDDRVFLLDLVNETWSELKTDDLPTITDDPLSWLREQKEEIDKKSEEGAGPGEEAPDNEDTTENDEAEPTTEGESESDDTEAKEKTRSANVNRIAWRPDGAAATIMLRSNDNKDRWIVLVEPGEDARLEPLHHVHDEAWINWAFNEMDWLRDGSGLWYLSEESGYGNLYVWSFDERESRHLAGADWEIRSVREGPSDGALYFLASSERPIEYQVHRAFLELGSRVERLTDVSGTVESFSLSPDGQRLLLTASSAILPPELSVLELVGSGTVQITDTVSETYESFPWVEPEFVAVPGDHGRPIWSKVYQQDGAWQGAGRPGVVFVHGAGYTQNSDDGWPYYFREQMFHSMLAHLGYVVIDMDYRASSGYGRDWRTAIYRDMGRPELSDLSDGIDWMVRTHGVDPEKIGIYGGSYGGFMALMALFLEPETYACGASLRPVTDWAHYNHGYTSNILNTPELDPEAFERSSPIAFAEGLADPLLICHGMLDDNVVFQDTVRLAQRLIELGKEDWEIAMYPLEPHSFTEASSWLDEYRRIFRLFERVLRPGQ